MSNISRRQFLKSAGVAALAVAALTGCKKLPDTDIPDVPGVTSVDLRVLFVDEKGNFLKNAVLTKKTDVDVEEVYAEYVAQMEKYIKLFGHKPTHIDGHHHTHALPQTIEATRRLAKAYDIKYVRHVDSDVAFISDFYGPLTDYNQFETTLKRHLDREYVELMCHVAFIDVDLIQCSTYNFDRVRELETLISSKAKDFVKEHNIELVNFRSY